MRWTLPRDGGEVNAYRIQANARSSPRIYYVNGIKTSPAEHAKTALALASLTEHVVHGVYNKTMWGGVVDLAQCLIDWRNIALSKAAERSLMGYEKIATELTRLLDRAIGRPMSGAVKISDFLRQSVPLRFRRAIVRDRLLSHNKAAEALFDQLESNRGRRQFIIAHSQGNLITSLALYAMSMVHGDESLLSMRVYSLASPTPAWPMGIRYRRKVYGHTADIVTFADPHNWTFITDRVFGGIFGRNAGHWSQYGGSGGIADRKLEIHGVYTNMALNFARTIRRDLGLPETREKAESRSIMSREKLTKQLILHEGNKPKVYNDSMGLPTIGVGFNLTRGDAKKQIESLGLNLDQVKSGKQALTDAQILKLLHNDIDTAIAECKSLFPRFSNLSDVRQRVLADMMFNLGRTRLSGFKKMMSHVDAGDFSKAADEMRNSKWYTQVKTRGPRLEAMMRTDKDPPGLW